MSSGAVPNRNLTVRALSFLLYQQEKRTCPTSSFSRSAPARCSCLHSTPAHSTDCEGARMLEPLFGLLVAIALGIYLIVTLLRPERF